MTPTGMPLCTNCQGCTLIEGRYHIKHFKQDSKLCLDNYVGGCGNCRLCQDHIELSLDCIHILKLTEFSSLEVPMGCFNILTLAGMYVNFTQEGFQPYCVGPL